MCIFLTTPQELFSSHKIWLGVLVSFVLCSPVIICNKHMTFFSHHSLHWTHNPLGMTIFPFKIIVLDEELYALSPSLSLSLSLLLPLSSKLHYWPCHLLWFKAHEWHVKRHCNSFAFLCFHNFWWWELEILTIWVTNFSQNSTISRIILN
jgi:hypothetical protein